MRFLWNVGVSVEYKWGCVSVSPHILENQPVTNFSTFKFRLFLTTDLVNSVTGWTENSSWHQIGWGLRRVNSFLQGHWNWVVVVVDYIVEWTIAPVIDIESLRIVFFTSLSAINLSRDCCRSTNKITAWLSNKPELTLAVVDFVFEIYDCLSYSWRNF